MNIDWIFKKLQHLRAIDYLLIVLAFAGIMLAWRRSTFAMLTHGIVRQGKRIP